MRDAHLPVADHAWVVRRQRRMRSRRRDPSSGLRRASGLATLSFIQTVEAEIFAYRRHEGAGHALTLKAQHHDHIGIFQPLPSNEDFRRSYRHAGRRSVDGATTYPAPSCYEENVGACDAGMQHIAANGDNQVFDSALARRMVSASRSAWVGCSCGSCHRLTTEQPTFCASRQPRPPKRDG